MNIKDTIKQKAAEIFGELVEMRRHLHVHPELSYQEKETAAFVAKKLKDVGIHYEENIGGFGVVGYIYGKNPDKKVFAL